MVYSVIHFFLTMWIVLGNINISSGKYLTVYRYLWNAREETSALPRFHLPIKYYYISTCQTKVCNTIQTCSLLVSKIQDEHMTKNGWHDIAYNFLVDPLGNVYEGTGWYKQVIKNEKEFLHIGLFGIEDFKNLPRDFLDGLENILQFGKNIGYLSRKVKPLLNFKEMNDSMTNEFWEKQLNWKKIILPNINDVTSDERKKEANSMESTEITTDVDWSKVFPNEGNRTVLDSVMSHKKIIEKSNWDKIFKAQDQHILVDWSSLSKGDPNHSINWSEIFNDDHIDISNFNMLFFSNRSQTNNRLSRNNRWKK